MALPSKELKSLWLLLNWVRAPVSSTLLKINPLIWDLGLNNKYGRKLNKLTHVLLTTRHTVVQVGGSKELGQSYI